MTAEEQPRITPKEDLMNEALRHYEEASNAIHHHRSDIPLAIVAYYVTKAETIQKDWLINAIKTFAALAVAEATKDCYPKEFVKWILGDWSKKNIEERFNYWKENVK